MAPLAILAVAIALGLSASLLAADRNRTVVQSSLADRTGEMTKVLRERLTIFQYGLRGARGAIVVAGVDKVTLADFRRYIGTRSLDQEFRGALGFGFIRRVAEADLPAFLDTMQRDGRPSFALKQFAPHAGERFVTQFLEPEERNRPALGADVASHDPRRATAIMAMRSGEVQLTPPLTLLQATGLGTQGFLLLLPVYRPGVDIATPEQRTQAAIGWTFVPLVVGDVLEKSDLIQDDLHFTIRDVTDTPDTEPFFRSHPGDGASVPGDAQNWARDERVFLFGRWWAIHFQAYPAFARPLNLTPPWIPGVAVTVGGALLSLLLQLHLQNLVRQRRAGEEKARQTALLEIQVTARTAELREREERFKSLTELSSDWYWEADRDGRFTDVSAGVARIGLDHAAMVGRTRRDLAADTKDPRLDEYEALVKAGMPFRDFGYDLIGNDGDMRHIVVSGAPVLDRRGICIGFRGSGRDVTEQRRAEQALMASQRFIRAIADNIPGMVGYWDTNLRCRFANKHYVEWFGKRPEEIIGGTMRSLLGERLFAETKTYLKMALAGRPQHFERMQTKADGSEGYIWAHFIPDIDMDGNVQGLFVLVTDVTDMKRAEQELRATTSRLILASKASGIGVWVYDAATGHIDWDEQMLQLYELPNGTADYMEHWAARCLPEDRIRVNAEFAEVVAGNGDLDAEFRIFALDGSIRHIKGASITDYGPDGRPVRIIGVNWDITDIRVREAALVAAQTAAEGVSRAKTDFLANMSHEIRTPLNAILGLAHLIERTELSPDQRGFAAKISAAGRGLLALVNDVLDFSKVEAGKLDLEPAIFDLPRLIDGVSSIVAVTAAEKKLPLYMAIDPGTPTALVGDQLRLQQVLINLVGNAIKFTESGNVALAVRRDGGDDKRPVLRFTVADTGIGIAPETVPTLFDAFTQADTSTTRRFGGSGLGLAISKRLVRLMGGDIGVDSVPGQGSTFWFTVPLDLADTTGQPAYAAPQPAAPASGQRLAGLMLLMVEDNTINQEVGRLILESEGAHIAIAGNGREALDRLTREPRTFDLVLMDMQMPIMDGYEATRRLRQELGLTTLPIIALTAGVLSGERERAYEAGITDFLTKPFDLEQMVQTIRQRLALPELDAVPAQATAAAPGFATIQGPLPGIDLRQAAMRLNGDGVMFTDLLRRFAREFGDNAPRIHDAIREGRVDEAAARLHTLRGAAGHMAANAAADSARIIETALRGGEAIDLDARILDLDGALKVLVDTAAGLAPASAEEAVPEAAGDLDRADLEALVQGLDAGRMDALDLYDRLRPALAGALGADVLALLQRDLDDLAFDAAADRLRPLINP
ncbi:MAG: CHASE domain-containing protein [Azospirillaceae bacterium]|nr:CHASE domain-containing protein [Azospirillaceae bacterium]